MTLNLTIVAVYLVGMLAFGWWGKARAASSEDYLVAGRRLGPVLFTGTMAAVVLGGAATVGGVGLGYEFGLSGAWLVAAIGVGVLILSVAFAPILARLKIYTVSQMLRLRYGRGGASHASSFVMLAYTLMLAATPRAPTRRSSWCSSAGTAGCPSWWAAASCWPTPCSAACGPSPWPTWPSSSS